MMNGDVSCGKYTVPALKISVSSSPSVLSSFSCSHEVLSLLAILCLESIHIPYPRRLDATTNTICLCTPNVVDSPVYFDMIFPIDRLSDWRKQMDFVSSLMDLLHDRQDLSPRSIMPECTKFHERGICKHPVKLASNG